MKFCSECGSSVSLKMPDGDNRERFVCIDCETIHYQNPKIVAGCIPEWDGKVLLCRRAIEPRHGFWTLPAGFMENGESTEDAAMRETWEEAQARINLLGLYSLFSIPSISQVYMLFRGEIIDGEFSPGIESLECKLFSESEIPWDQLAFKVVHETLKQYYSDRAAGKELVLRIADIHRPSNR
ncbi:MAG: NUDIX hydrolase [Gammaproteobacteria bacterium]